MADASEGLAFIVAFVRSHVNVECDTRTTQVGCDATRETSRQKCRLRWRISRQHVINIVRTIWATKTAHIRDEKPRAFPSSKRLQTPTGAPAVRTTVSGCLPRRNRTMRRHAGGTFLLPKPAVQTVTQSTASDGVNDPVSSGWGHLQGRAPGSFTPSLAHWTMHQSDAGGRHRAPPAQSFIGAMSCSRRGLRGVRRHGSPRGGERVERGVIAKGANLAGFSHGSPRGAIGSVDQARQLQVLAPQELNFARAPTSFPLVSEDG